MAAMVLDLCPAMGNHGHNKLANIKWQLGFNMTYYWQFHLTQLLPENILISLNTLFCITKFVRVKLC